MKDPFRWLPVGLLCRRGKTTSHMQTSNKGKEPAENVPFTNDILRKWGTTCSNIAVLRSLSHNNVIIALLWSYHPDHFFE